MRIYLVQHGEAKKEDEDPLRPLTEEGIKNAEKVASHLAKLNLKIKKIFHSGKLRAKQTAEIYGKYLKPEEGIEESEGLNPLDNVKIWIEKLRLINKDIMLVGHLPHLSRLTSTLIIDYEEKEVLKFKMAGTVCLEKNEKEKWSILWAIPPDIIP